MAFHFIGYIILWDFNCFKIFNFIAYFNINVKPIYWGHTILYHLDLSGLLVGWFVVGQYFCLIEFKLICEFYFQTVIKLTNKKPKPKYRNTDTQTQRYKFVIQFKFL